MKHVTSDRSLVPPPTDVASVASSAVSCQTANNSHSYLLNLTYVSVSLLFSLQKVPFSRDLTGHLLKWDCAKIVSKVFDIFNNVILICDANLFAGMSEFGMCD